MVTKAGLTVDLHEGIKEDVNIYLKGEAQKSKRGEEIYRGGYTMTLLHRSTPGYRGGCEHITNGRKGVSEEKKYTNTNILLSIKTPRRAE